MQLVNGLTETQVVIHFSKITNDNHMHIVYCSYLSLLNYIICEISLLMYDFHHLHAPGCLHCCPDAWQISRQNKYQYDVTLHSTKLRCYITIDDITSTGNGSRKQQTLKRDYFLLFVYIYIYIYIYILCLLVPS